MSFEAIMEAARNKDDAALARALGKPKNITIDILKKGTHDLTPAAQLAVEGNLEAVEFLRQRGASVHRIARAFALAGNIEQTEIYRTGYNANVTTIAEGFAAAGNIEQAEIYRTKHKADASWIAFGFALGGHIEQVELYRTQHRADVSEITKRFALGGHEKHAETYRVRYDVADEEIAVFYAIAGNVKMAEMYRTEHGVDVDQIASGFALGGDIEQVELYHTKHGAGPFAIGLGFDQAGNIAQAVKYVNQFTAMDEMILLLHMLEGSFLDPGYKEWNPEPEQSNENQAGTHAQPIQTISPVVAARPSQDLTRTVTQSNAQRKTSSSSSTCWPFMSCRTAQVAPKEMQQLDQGAKQTPRKERKCSIQ